jgi:hypothetical protein
MAICDRVFATSPAAPHRPDANGRCPSLYQPSTAPMAQRWGSIYNFSHKAVHP